MRQAALRVMTPTRTGSIVILRSISGRVSGVQSGVAYATLEAAVIGLTKALARYGGAFGIRVNCVNPGYIEAGMSLGMTAVDRERTIAATPWDGRARRRRWRRRWSGSLRTPPRSSRANSTSTVGC